MLNIIEPQVEVKPTTEIPAKIQTVVDPHEVPITEGGLLVTKDVVGRVIDSPYGEQLSEQLLTNDVVVSVETCVALADFVPWSDAAFFLLDQENAVRFTRVAARLRRFWLTQRRHHDDFVANGVDDLGGITIENQSSWDVARSRELNTRHTLATDAYDHLLNVSLAVEFALITLERAGVVPTTQVGKLNPESAGVETTDG